MRRTFKLLCSTSRAVKTEAKCALALLKWQTPNIVHVNFFSVLAWCYSNIMTSVNKTQCVPATLRQQLQKINLPLVYILWKVIHLRLLQQFHDKQKNSMTFPSSPWPWEPCIPTTGQLTVRHLRVPLGGANANKKEKKTLEGVWSLDGHFLSRSPQNRSVRKRLVPKRDSSKKVN